MIDFEGSTGISRDVAGPVLTTGSAAVKRSVLSVRLAGTDCDGSTDGRLRVGEITIGGTSSVALKAPDFSDIGIGNVFDGCFSPKVSEALAEIVCRARESPAGAEESVTEGTGAERPPASLDGAAGFSEARSVCALREASFPDNRSVTGGKGAEDGKSVTRGTEDGGVLSADEPVSIAREGSVNGGKSVAKGLSVFWGAFTVAASVCAAREASVDGDKSINPGTKVRGLSDA